MVVVLGAQKGREVVNEGVTYCTEAVNMCKDIAHKAAVAGTDQSRMQGNVRMVGEDKDTYVGREMLEMCGSSVM